MKSFNTTAVCVPTKHYMLDISDRVQKIRKLIDKGEYFTINRARQYGKTTTLNALKESIADIYTVISIGDKLLYEGILTNSDTQTHKLGKLRHGKCPDSYRSICPRRHRTILHRTAGRVYHEYQ